MITISSSRIILGAAIILATPVVAQQPGGQAPPPTTQMVLKGKAPVSEEILKVKLPVAKEATLPNGLRLMVLEDHRVPQVSFQLMIPGAGGYFDPQDRAGLATWTAAIIREGTSSKTSAQISEALETMGASLFTSAGASSANAEIDGNALTESLPKLMEVAADVLLHPAFAQAEWDRYKARTKPQFTQLRTNPNFLGNEMLNKAVFGSHPASRIFASATAIDAVTAADLSAYYKSHYVPDHAVLAFAGDITVDQAKSLATKYLGEWKKAGVPEAKVSNPAPIGPAKVYLINRPNSVQTTFYVGTQALLRTDPDYMSLTVANRVLGGVMGRLFRHLREEKGYTYGIGSGIESTPYVGAWLSSTSVRTEVTEPALRDLMAEIAEMRDTPVPAKELADSKRALVATFALSLESPQRILGYSIDRWELGLPADYYDTYPARVSAVTAAQAQAAAKKYWDPNRLQIVAVGDASKIRDILAKFGTVEVYDADGKPVITP
jgi:predicted Zn-dependent peptidase